LTVAERDLARQLELGAIQELRSGLGAMVAFSDKALPTLLATTAGKEGKSVVTEVKPIAKSSERLAQVSRFDYPTGLTIRTIVDLGDSQVIGIKADALFPTPLASEEAGRAIAIAAEAIPELAGLAPDAPSLQFLPIIDTAITSPTYGHRLVVVWRKAPTPSDRVLVDLSNEAIAERKF
jgi:hypothetical protein